MRPDQLRLARVAVAVPLLVVSVSCCWLCTPHEPIGDVVSGEPKGSAAVKVQVTLTEADTGCAAAVDPQRVIVFHGSVIRWRVVNNCRKALAPHLEFTRPTPVKGTGTPGGAEAWSYAFCTPRIDKLKAGDDTANVLHCEVPDRVALGVYKYGLRGAAELDPEIEVRKGGK